MAAPTIDGVNTNLASSTNTVSATITTTQSNDVIIVDTYCEQSGGGPAVTSVTATGLTFSLRVRSHGSARGSHEIWWAIASSPLSSLNITVTYAANFDDNTLLVYGVAGCATPNPWDTNSGLPQTAHWDAAFTPSFTLNTDQTNDLILFTSGVDGSAGALPGDPTGFSNIANRSNGGGAQFASSRAVGKAVTAQQSGVTVAASAAAGSSGGEVILDALTAGGSPSAGNYRFFFFA